MGPEDCYVGTKIVTATPMDKHTFRDSMNRPPDRDNQPGYRVTYPDGYVSWSPKETFEIAYRKVTEAEKGLLV